MKIMEVKLKYTAKNLYFFLSRQQKSLRNRLQYVINFFFFVNYSLKMLSLQYLAFVCAINATKR